jgi:DNA uptake protein ComE-like DNA-binding protein
MPSVAGRQVDINAASASDLATLPGVGPVRANAIIAARPYKDATEVVSKNVLPQGVFDGFKDRVALANINTSSAADLQRTLTQIGDVRSKAIVAGRPYASPTDLVTKKVISQTVFNLIKDDITY